MKYKYKINNREVSEEEYSSSKEDGIHSQYPNNGQSGYKYECNYLNGQWHGFQRAWFRNEQLRYEYEYLNGKQHGLQREWYVDGQIRHEMIFVNGIDRTKDLKNNKLAQVIVFGKVIFYEFEEMEV